MATHSSVLASRIPGMGEPGGLPSMGLHRVGHDWSDLAAAAATVENKKTYKHTYSQESWHPLGETVHTYTNQIITNKRWLVTKVKIISGLENKYNEWILNIKYRTLK